MGLVVHFECGSVAMNDLSPTKRQRMHRVPPALPVSFWDSCRIPATIAL